MQAKPPPETQATSQEPPATVTHSGDLASWKQDAEKRAHGRLPESPNKLRWSLRPTPPFPEHWPVTGTPTAVAYYAGAYVLGLPNLRDGEYSAGLAYRIEIRTDGSAATTILADPTREVGVQGVRPLTGDEVLIVRKRAEVEQALLAAARTGVMPNPDAANELRAYYKLWFSTNGIGSDIRKYHTEFAKWLGLP